MTTLDTMVAADIMTKALIAVSPQQDLLQLESLLLEHHIGGAPVVEQGRLVGVVSRSDIARMQFLMNSLDGQVMDRLRSDDQADGFQHTEQAEFRGFRQTLDKLKVRDAMHDQVITCTPETLVTSVAAIMVGHHIHRVIVVEGEKPVGIISSLDVAKLVAHSAAKPARNA